MKKNLRYFMTLLLMMVASVGWGQTTIIKKDVLNLSFTGVTTGNNYADWSKKTAESGAVYAGNSAGGNESIQLRSNNSNSGVVSTTSGGELKKITVTWNSSTTSGRTLNVYGSNTAYTNASDLYDSNKQGTLIGTIVCGDTSTELTVTGDYEYVGLRSASGAMYLTKVEIEWEQPSTETPTVAKPTFSPEAGEVTQGTDVTITAAVGCVITYTTDGTDPTESATATTTESNTTTVTVNEAITIKAVAVDASAELSAVAVAAYTIKTPAQEPKEGDYVKVTSTDDITDGIYLIVYEKGGLAFDGGLPTLDATGNTISVKITNNTIAGSETVDAAAFTINANVGSIKSTSGYYIGRTTNSNGLESSQTQAYTNNIVISNENAIITSSGNPTLQYYNTSGQERFRYYKSNQQPIALYKKVVAEDTREDANFSFPEASYTIEQGDEFIAPTLSKADGYDGKITYTISGDDIATIDSKTGELTLNGSAGSALITATGTGSTTFKDDEASYSLTVAVVCQNIAALKALDSGTEAILTLTDAQVLYKGSNDMYVKDATGAIDFYQITDPSYAAGQVLNGTAKVTYTLYNNGLPEITAVSESNITATDGTANPEELEVADVTLTDYVCDLVKVSGTLVKEEGTSYTDYFISDGTNKLQIYNKFQDPEINLANLTGNTYIATGIVVPFKGEAELALTALEEVATVTLSPTKEYTTLTSAYALDFTDTGLSAYIVKEEDVTATSVKLTQVNKVPARTGLVIQKTVTKDSYSVPVLTGNPDDVSENKMVGSATKTTAIAKNAGYILKDGKFSPSAAGTLAKGKAYLAVAVAVPPTGEAKDLAIVFGEGTGINNVNVNENESGKIFNLSGQQMKSAVKGVYIKNGKKYIK